MSDPNQVRTPTDEQRDVIHATDPRFVVLAAAGAGKTYVLVERYLRFVEKGLRPDQILTITFTKKAAAEMKKRIVESLRAKGRPEDAQIAETGPIQTIHSFCERLLRENALEARLDPNFEILGEGHSSRLITECVREALASELDEEPHAEALVSYLAGQRRYGENRSPYAKLEAAIESVLHELRGSGYKQLQIREWHLNPRTLAARWEEAIVGAQPESVRAMYGQIDMFTLHERLSQAFKMADMRVPAWLRSRTEDDAEQETLVHTCGLVQLACSAWWRLDREMLSRQSLDFAELETRAVRLIQESEVTRERLRRQYQVVMVDEAQDLNPTQYELLRQLNFGQEMMVGDVQQSIYGFRMADVELFRRRGSEVSTMQLNKNHRSDEGILAFVDLVFGSLWSGDYRPMSPPAKGFDFDDVTPPNFGGVELWQQDAKDSMATARYIQELLGEGVSPKEVTVLVRDSGGALDIHRALQLLKIEARIAGGSEKFYTKIEVRDLANILRSVADPYDDFSLLASLRSPVCGLSFDSIVVLSQQTPVVEALEAFVPPIEDDKPKLAAFLSWFVPLKEYADRLSAWEVLAEIFARSDYLPALARRESAQQLLANARKLLSLATEEPELGPLEYAEQIREIQDLRHKEGDAPAGAEDADLVTIMTIHKAKGLEFPVVVLPQTMRNLAPRPKDVVIEPRKGLVVTKFGRVPSLMHRFLSEERRKRDVEEELRVLYVGLTRAKHRLCLCLYPNTRDETFSKKLHAILGPSPDSSIRIRSSMSKSGAE